MREEFEALFGETFHKESNTKYLNHIMTCYANKRWKDLVKLMMHVEKPAFVRAQEISNELSERLVLKFIAYSKIVLNAFSIGGLHYTGNFLV
jgi:hypothetical protein